MYLWYPVCTHARVICTVCSGGRVYNERFGFLIQSLVCQGFIISQSLLLHSHIAKVDIGNASKPNLQEEETEGLSDSLVFTVGTTIIYRINTLTLL